ATSQLDQVVAHCLIGEWISHCQVSSYPAYAPATMAVPDNLTTYNSPHPRGQPDAGAAEKQIRQPGRHQGREVATGPQRHAKALQNEISEADKNARGNADEHIAPARRRAEGNGDQHDNQAC